MTTTPNTTFATGVIKGTGAAINISIGWVPRRVELYNHTDGDIVTVGLLRKRIPFTSGGVVTISAGQTIKGVTSGALAKINEVLLISGTFAGGDAAGTFYIEPEDITGTFQSENVIINGTADTDDATVTVQVEAGYKIDTATAAVVTTSALSAYLGSSTAGKGFTIGSVAAENAKELIWTAWR